MEAGACDRPPVLSCVTLKEEERVCSTHRIVEVLQSEITGKTGGAKKS